VRVIDVVGLIERVNGWVVGIGEGLSVPVTDRVRLSDLVSEIVAEGVPVARRDAGTVGGGERLILRERVSVTDTVGLIDRVNG